MPACLCLPAIAAHSLSSRRATVPVLCMALCSALCATGTVRRGLLPMGSKQILILALLLAFSAWDGNAHICAPAGVSEAV